MLEEVESVCIQAEREKREKYERASDFHWQAASLFILHARLTPPIQLPQSARIGAPAVVSVATTKKL